MKLEIISKYPVESQHPTPLLFIHGMLHGAWCWDAHFLDFFAQHGYAAHTVNLRGHGNSEGRERLRWTRIADFVEDVANAVRQLPSPPILIGHSMGGFVIQKYLEDHDSPGAVLLSSPPPAGLLATTLRIARRRPLVFAKANLTLSLLPVIATPQLAREAFFSADFPDEELLTYWKQMQDESYMALLDMVALDRPEPAKVKAPCSSWVLHGITCSSPVKSKQRQGRTTRRLKSSLMWRTTVCSSHAGRAWQRESWFG